MFKTLLLCMFIIQVSYAADNNLYVHEILLKPDFTTQEDADQGFSTIRYAPIINELVGYIVNDNFDTIITMNYQQESPALPREIANHLLHVVASNKKKNTAQFIRIILSAGAAPLTSQAIYSVTQADCSNMSSLNPGHPFYSKPSFEPRSISTPLLTAMFKGNVAAISTFLEKNPALALEKVNPEDNTQTYAWLSKMCVKKHLADLKGIIANRLTATKKESRHIHYLMKAAIKQLHKKNDKKTNVH